MKINRRKGKNPLAELFAKPLSAGAKAEYQKLMKIDSTKQQNRPK